MKDARLETLELFIAKFLRYGVLLAGVVILAGWMSQIDFHHNVFEAFQTYKKVPLTTEIDNLWRQGGWGLITAYGGLILLAALPFSRVLLTAGVFLFEKDYIMAACAILVMIGLGLSLALGFAA